MSNLITRISVIQLDDDKYKVSYFKGITLDRSVFMDGLDTTKMLSLTNLYVKVGIEPGLVGEYNLKQ